ncbi:MAG TPA: hypothetical protein VK826_15135 [Bacteroidia bacterium]|nr:hypothetical protein [Bacteroidia bacterium]
MNLLFRVFALIVLLCPKLSAQTCSVQITTVPENCGQVCNGSAQANPTGSAPFSYLWQPGGQTTQQITGLCTGTYTVIVTDSTGCVAMDTSSITTAPPLNVWISSFTNPSCVGCSDGSATGSVNGGSPGYYPFWIPPIGFGLYTVSGISAGSYTFCVTDTNGCTSCVDTVLQDPLSVAEFGDESLPASVELYDLSGRLIWLGTFNEWNQRSPTEFKTGCYILIGRLSSHSTSV